MGNIFEKEMQKPTVFKDRNIISPHYIPNILPYRDKQIGEISGILANALRGKKPNNLFIYGKTGIGKTSVTKFVLKQMHDYSDKNDCLTASTYVNCRNHPSKYKVLLKCCKAFFPQQSFLGFSSGFVFEKLVDFVKETKKEVILVLDEIDKVKDVDDLVYSVTRANDELESGSLTILGISNNLLFKDKLDPRTKSSLCEEEMVFPPYNADELKEILTQRISQAFNENVVEEGAISLAAALAAQESGDARTAVMLMLKAGEIADRMNLKKVSDEEVLRAKKIVEEEIIISMISTLPGQEQLVLYSIAELTKQKKGIRKITGEEEAGVLYSGEVYEKYSRVAKRFNENTVSTRWFRQYINELDMYGLIVTTASGSGQRGNTTFIKLGFDADKIREALDKQLN